MLCLSGFELYPRWVPLPYVHSNHFMKIFFQSLVYFFII